MRLKRYITELAMKKETELRVDVSNSGNYIVRIKLDPLSTEKYRFSAKRFNSDQRDYESFEWNYGSLPDKIIDSMEKNFKKNIYDLTFWEVFFKDNAGNIQQVKHYNYLPL